jgi:hypothetical protein
MMSVTTRKQASMPAADMQRRARKIALQAARLADQAGPATRKAASTAKRGAGGAASWAGPRVGRARTWLAIRATRGSVSVQERLAPRVASMLASTARKLDPPKRKSRRVPRIMAGAALLAAGAAAAAAMAMRNKQRGTAMTARPPARTGQPATVMSPEDRMSDSEVNGLSRTTR